jgi:CheY-specific phosphatase CheX
LAFGRRMDILADELEELGASVVNSHDEASCLSQLDSIRDVSVLVLSGDMGRESASSVLATSKRRYGSLPAIWVGGLLDGAPLSDFRATPDAILHEPLSAGVVHAKMRELLLGPYSGTAAALLQRLVGDVVRESYALTSTPSVVRVNAIHRMVNDVNTIVAFCGTGISGRILVSADESTLLRIYRRAVTGDRTPGRREAEDLAGEIANLAAGKLKFAFDQFGVVCEIGTPLVVGRTGVVLRPSHGNAALCAELDGEYGSLRAELTIDRCGQEQSERLAAALVEPSFERVSEVCFF